ncbi:Formyltransferase/hydrolase complex Fhc subunit C [Aquisphaera giovannonii]|uniref:Formyltransferase/hydrolase complex Fhc subunit C n=1 Tax=Aquisphaera giovannonii TaxID=406548 RepID=A0A5B9WA67_9BACT|nr:formylmethanofuran dehydrogenase subunit C [Aquisphaera giovannonii]QEH37337.1 Formyltransferase/hydrolase complex Fhc subunit C [Aquisphaera giovannonii]
MSLTITWRGATALPVDGRTLKPATFAVMSVDEARRVAIRVGNGKVELGELFDVRGGGGGDGLTIEGDLRGVRGIGRRMAAGTMVLRGDVGAELGAEMSGGIIELHGSAGPYAGAEMRGGRLSIRGDAGDHLGAAYPGSRLGMREGVILVEGRAGEDVGAVMRRGLIAIRGDVGAGLGRGMIAGTALVLGAVGRQAGAGMKRGSLILPDLDGQAEAFLVPTFAPAGRYPAPFLEIYYRQLEAWGFAIPRAISSRMLHRYNGDVLIGGRGEVLAGIRGG